jgi:hypothetical protein
MRGAWSVRAETPDARRQTPNIEWRPFQKHYLAELPTGRNLGPSDGLVLSVRPRSTVVDEGLDHRPDHENDCRHVNPTHRCIPPLKCQGSEEDEGSHR